MKYQLEAVAQESLAEFGQSHAAWFAVEQRGADELFELLDARGTDRARDPHLARGFGEVLRFGDTNESVYGEKTVHGCGRTPGPRHWQRIVRTS